MPFIEQEYTQQVRFIHDRGGQTMVWVDLLLKHNISRQTWYKYLPVCFKLT